MVSVTDAATEQGIPSWRVSWLPEDEDVVVAVGKPLQLVSRAVDGGKLTLRVSTAKGMLGSPGGHGG